MPFSRLIKSNINLANKSLDRNHLQRVRDNYLALNRFRIDYAREIFPKAHSLYLDVLPALFHFNHPMLPGFCDRNTPAGLYGFTLGRQQHQQLNRLARSFHPNRTRSQQPDIQAIYTMGSLGSSAQNASSDVDIWLCHRPDLSPKQIKLLEKKAASIQNWARGMNIETTIFLMNDRAFASGTRMKLDKESSGSTQHFLLLDEFYRTAIWLGGQLPAWIFTDSNDDENYQSITRDLVGKKRIRDRQLVDFGLVPKISPGECISAAIWNLYKAIESPYKAIIKLLLIQIYITRSDESEYLSAEFKRWLHTIEVGEQLTLSDYDPYLSVYQSIERYLLETDQQGRLELLQRCFYFKLAHPDFKIKNPSLLEKQTVIDQLTQSWGWDEATLRHLDNRANWKIATVNKERQAIIDQLNYSYHFILDFFRQEQSDTDYSNRELNILGRKLHAAFSKKAGKIDWINPNISGNITEKSLLISHRTQGWEAMFNHESATSLGSTPLNANRKTITKSSLIELLSWLHCNRIMNSQTRLHLDTSLTSIPLEKCRKIISELIPAPLKLAEHHHFQTSASLTKVVIFFHSFESSDYFLLQHKGQHENNYLNQRCSIDVISLNSWNEIRCESREGTVVELICELFSNLLHVMDPQAKTHFYFFEEFIAHALSQQLAKLYKDIFDFFNQKMQGRYLLKSGERFLIMSQHPELEPLEVYENEEAVYDGLNAKLNQFSALSVDETTLKQHEIGLFAQLNKKGSTQVFVENRGNLADLVIVDEHGVFSRITMDYSQGAQSLSPLFMFLRVINQRLQNQANSEVNPLDISPIAFYRIYFEHGHWCSEALYVNAQPIPSSMLEISAVAEMHGNQLMFTLECSNQTLSEPMSGDVIYRQLGLLIQRQKHNSSVLPLAPGYFICDLDISRCYGALEIHEQAGTADYLKVAAQLNQNIADAF